MGLLVRVRRTVAVLALQNGELARTHEILKGTKQQIKGLFVTLPSEIEAVESECHFQNPPAVSAPPFSWAERACPPDLPSCHYHGGPCPRGCGRRGSLCGRGRRVGRGRRRVGPDSVRCGGDLHADL